MKGQMENIDTVFSVLLPDKIEKRRREGYFGSKEDAFDPLLGLFKFKLYDVKTFCNGPVVREGADPVQSNGATMK
jgi:hypothetical protein